jgi:predicted dehydrogenase
MPLISKNTPELRIAIAGMGKMGSYHFKAISRLADGQSEVYYKGDISKQLCKLRICGICDILESRLNPHGEIPGFDNFEQMAEKTRPDMAVIAVPTQMHYELACASLRRGIHTLVEKPIVTSSSELDQLIKIAGEKQCQLTAGHIERYNPVSIKIKSLLQTTGSHISCYEFVRTQKHHARISDDIISDKVIHDLDLAVCFFGAIRNIKVDSVKFKDGKAHEARLLIEHSNGTSGSIFVSWLDCRQDSCRHVTIRQGSQSWKGDFLSKKLAINGIQVECNVEGMINIANNQIKDELVDFIASCCDITDYKIKPLLSMEDIVEATRWLEHIINTVKR